MGLNVQEGEQGHRGDMLIRVKGGRQENEGGMKARGREGRTKNNQNKHTQQRDPQQFEPDGAIKALLTSQDGLLMRCLKTFSSAFSSVAVAALPAAPCVIL